MHMKLPPSSHTQRGNCTMPALPGLCPWRVCVTQCHSRHPFEVMNLYRQVLRSARPLEHRASYRDATAPPPPVSSDPRQKSTRFSRWGLWCVLCASALCEYEYRNVQPCLLFTMGAVSLQQRWCVEPRNKQSLEHMKKQKTNEKKTCSSRM